MHEILIDVKEVSGKAVPAVTSLQVAEVFEKQHKTVLQDIDRILSQVPEIFGRLNFEPSEYELKNNLGFPVRHPMYILTKDAFTLLTMGYTGEKAMRFKIAYIERFNEMERQLREMTERREKEEDAFSRRVGRTLDDLSTIFKYAGLQGNQIALALDRMVKKETGVSPIESSGVMLVNHGNSQLLTPRALGKMLKPGRSAQAVNKLLESMGLQRCVRDARRHCLWEPTDAGLQAGATMVDVGKRHGGGAPVCQLRWPASIAATLEE